MQEHGDPRVTAEVEQNAKITNGHISLYREQNSLILQLLWDPHASQKGRFSSDHEQN